MNQKYDDHSQQLERMIARILHHEGGYVDHPSDPGGKTKYGITQRTAHHYGYRGDMRDLTQPEAELMYVEILSEAGVITLLSRYGFAVAWQFADAVVNHGGKRASKIFQITVGAKPDGIIGQKTHRAAKQYNATQLTVCYIAQRQKFYLRLATFKSFGKGWCNRISNNLLYASEDLKHV